MHGLSLLQTGELRAVFSGCASPVSILLTACSCFRTAPKSEQKHARGPFTPSPLLLRRFPMEAFPCDALSCCRAGDCGPAWNEAEEQRTVAQDKVLMETHSLCAWTRSEMAGTCPTPKKRWISFSRHTGVISHTSGGPVAGTGGSPEAFKAVSYLLRQHSKRTESPTPSVTCGDGGNIENFQLPPHS